jgi:hypothetical protein
MGNGFRYAVVGSGRWGRAIQSILQGMGRSAKMIVGTRRGSQETSSDYLDRLRTTFQCVDAEIAWVCVPPGPNGLEIVRSVVESGMHTVVEKPWTYDVDQTRILKNAAERNGTVLGVHFQYCFLEELGRISNTLADRQSWRFDASFVIPRENRLGMPAGQNLGCHLIAIHQRYFSDLALDHLEVGYSGGECRQIRLRAGRGSETDTMTIDFTHNTQPLIQRFVQSFENAVDEREGLTFDLCFALRVNKLVVSSEQNGLLLDVSGR